MKEFIGKVEYQLETADGALKRAQQLLPTGSHPAHGVIRRAREACLEVAKMLEKEANE